ncbi:MAG TPA: PPOX class F420-dependent oxidoreductase [Nitrososphaeraceae archaeon]|nr:PPOX class F420-dependent oxidoreductase [Nitrososphaeraceae archaeon]
MTKSEIKEFLMKDTFTGKLATVKKNGSPHVVPIWFVVEEVNSRNRNKVGNIYFTTGRDSVKAQNIQRDSRVSICVDDQAPPFSFVLICGNAKVIPYRRKEVLKWATKIAERYMGKKNAKAYGERNSGEEEVLVRIRPIKVIAGKDVAI